MKKPLLGKQTFLPDNTDSIMSFEKFVNESYNSNVDPQPLYTGRYFVIVKEGARIEEVYKVFDKGPGFKVANTRDFGLNPVNESAIEDADVLVYEELGIALVGGDDAQIKLLESSSSDDFFLIPEKIVYVPQDAPSIISGAATWGISKTQSNTSAYTGKGVKVAVLDTGFDSNHPDFAGRNLVTQSFVQNETAQDMHGHGTHCIGTACGRADANSTRYGVAGDATIYAGKVLNNQGSGAQAWIINGMNWAVSNGCKVISMSLGSRVFPGQSYDLAYERAGQYALSNGTVVVAAAGNESRRTWGQFSPVGSPADCPSVLAVAAIDNNSHVAEFSNRCINPTGEVDIASAGVDVYSSWLMPTRYRSISGTSMATPHVAGILALLWEKYPSASPYQIISELKRLALRLPISNTDIGVGLSIAP